jgi:hypothetical protein
MAADPGKSEKYGTPNKITVTGTRLAKATAAIRRLLLATPEETSDKAVLWTIEPKNTGRLIER